MLEVLNAVCLFQIDPHLMSRVNSKAKPPAQGLCVWKKAVP